MNSEEILDEQQLNPKKKNTIYPYCLIWGFIPILIIWIIKDVFPNSAIDIQMHDTYFVIAKSFILSSLAIYFGIVGFIYWCLRKANIRNWLTNLHLAITLLFIPILILLFTKIYIFVLPSEINYVVPWLIIAFIIGQLLFLLNILIQLLRKFKIIGGDY